MKDVLAIIVELNKTLALLQSLGLKVEGTIDLKTILSLVTAAR